MHPGGEVERAKALMRLLRGAGLFLAELIGMVTLIVVSNTVKLTLFARRDEIGIMKLVGASSFSIQLPFLLEGAIAGVLGAGLATGSFVLIKAVLVDRVLAPNFPITRFITWGDVWLSSISVFVIGVALAAIASFLTLMKYLRV